ncbi:Hypothetical protein AA314_04083 [Archangium gephyra]|uniref:Uncharacterized protein n=1 Tax=Archangium gephyra TaxID=48 RepID=A0AAC8TE24_9BACT|nr:Hypothetical protein AA314_04083 [Archangium gephyra]
MGHGRGLSPEAGGRFRTRILPAAFAKPQVPVSRSLVTSEKFQ